MSEQSEQQNNAATPSPTPSPTPQPHFRTLEELKRSATPPPPLIRSLEPFEWAELNRANEILKFFDTAITIFVKRANVDAPVIAMLRIALATRLSEIILRKYQMTSTSFNIEAAINVIDEQLPKLLKSSGINAEDILRTWNVLKEFVQGAKK
jgi:hypothetical protein